MLRTASKPDQNGHAKQTSSLSPGSVVLEINDFDIPEMAKEKPVISAAEAVKCIKSGMDDSSLMSTFNISAKGLRSLFRKLVASGAIAQQDIDERIAFTHDWAVLEQ